MPSSPSSATAVLDAIIVGAGPSGLAASLALAGWRPHYVPKCTVEDDQLAQRLQALLHRSPSGLLESAAVPALSNGLRGRSNNPAALLFDALHHPGADSQRVPNPRCCLELRHDPTAALSHVLLDPQKPGGSWHGMHEATRTLSPGTWLQLPPPAPGLADHLLARESGLTPAAAVQAAAARQPRSLIAGYYEAVADRFGAAVPHRSERVVAVRWNESGRNEADANADECRADATWTVELADAPPLRARSLVLAVGTAGLPRRLGIEGEDLPLVAHRCTEPSDGAHVVLVVGAGLSAADCLVHHLQRGRQVYHLFRGAVEATKVGSKFGAAAAAGFYPEYYALTRAMAGGTRMRLLGGEYEPLQGAELRAVRPDGRCLLGLAGGDGDGVREVRADAVAVLIGSGPDLRFLPPEVLSALEAAGPPPDEHEGVKATHPVHVEVDPWSAEAKAWPTLHCLGPLRGDNFARFAIHDGYGVSEAIRARSKAAERGDAPSPAEAAADR
jgi:hypothetical protein